MRCLAEGIDPITGEVFPADSPYQQADIIRALYAAVEALEKSEQRQKREQGLHTNAGKPWDVAEDEQLCRSFDEGIAVKELSKLHGRTHGAIQSRLEKLGKMLP